MSKAGERGGSGGPHIFCRTRGPRANPCGAVPGEGVRRRRAVLRTRKTRRAARGWNPGAADVSTDAPDYADGCTAAQTPIRRETSEAFAEEEEAHGSGATARQSPGGAADVATTS